MNNPYITPKRVYEYSLFINSLRTKYKYPVSDSFDLNVLALDAITVKVAVLILFNLNYRDYACIENFTDMYKHMKDVLKECDTILEANPTNRDAILLKNKFIGKLKSNGYELTGAASKVLLEHIDTLAEMMRLSYLSEKLNTLTEWRGLETVLTPQAFFAWAKSKGFELPPSVENWLAEQNTAACSVQVAISPEHPMPNTISTIPNETPKEYATRLLNSGMSKESIMRKLYNEKPFGKKAKWECVAIVNNLDIAAIRHDVSEQNKLCKQFPK